MTLNSRLPDDRVIELMETVYWRYGILMTATEAKLLRLMMDVRTASYMAIDDLLWPNADGFDIDFDMNRRVHKCRLQKKFGKLIDIVTFSGAGYCLKRLGPIENPLHERK